ERHADFLADDDEARDVRHEATSAARAIAWAGADYVPPADLEARLAAALDRAPASAAEETGRTTSPGFASPGPGDTIEPARQVVEARPGRNTDPRDTPPAHDDSTAHPPRGGTTPGFSPLPSA